jgi:DNA-binding transcriptional LysR family regulator
MRGSEFAELKALTAVVELGGFARAARHLGVSPSALSQTIRSLEARLGLTLINRTTRSLAPTEAGAALVRRVRPAFADIEAAVSAAAELRDRPAGRLRINATRVAATQYLAPLIGPFLKAHPDITLDLTVDERLVDIVAAGYDAGVRLGERLQKDMIAVPLSGDIRLLVVASPAYLAERGVPRTPEELQEHRCINFRWPTTGQLYRWELERDGHALEVAVEGPLVTDEPEVSVRAARDGVGLALVFEAIARPMIARGELVAVMEDWCPPFPGFYLYFPSRRTTPALRALIDFIAERRTGG